MTAGRVSHPARNGPPGGASVRIVIARRSRQSGDNVGRGGLYRIADRALHDDAPLSKQLGVGCSKWSCDLSRPSLWHPHRQYLSPKELHDCGRDCHGDRALGGVEKFTSDIICGDSSAARDGQQQTGGEFLSARVWMDTTCAKGTIRHSSSITRLHSI